MDDLARYQDICGQLMFLKTYTQLLLCFRLREDVDQASVTNQLEKAALSLTSTFPWLAGQVINEGSGPGNTGNFKVAPYEPHTNKAPVIVKDCSRLCPTYDEIIKAEAPVSMLDGDVLAPRKGLPLSYDKSEEPAPVMIIQANFITGGLLLTFAGQHNVMDMNGQGQLIRLFAKSLRGEAFTETEISEGNRDRRGIIPLLAPDEPLRDHSLMRPLPSAANAQPNPDPAPVSWANFHFPAAKLAQLKSLASKHIGQDPIVPWISTNDALAAFIWQRVSAVRLLRRQRPHENTTISRAVNVRRALRPAVPEQYMGHMVGATYSRLTFQQVAESDLSTLAFMIRKVLNEIDDYAIRSLVTLIDGEPDRSTISYSAQLDLTTDLLLSSWADLRLSGTVFGSLLGKPELVRRPNFLPLEGLNYMMPRTEGGDIVAALCLRDVDIEALQKDKNWSNYAEYIG